jgi:hypothetical protein
MVETVNGSVDGAVEVVDIGEGAVGELVPLEITPAPAGWPPARDPPRHAGSTVPERPSARNSARSRSSAVIVDRPGIARLPGFDAWRTPQTSARFRQVA